MNQYIENAIQELHKVLKAQSSHNTVSVNVFFNSGEYSLEIQCRTWEGLKAEGVSMRNIRGDFIKETD